YANGIITVTGTQIGIVGSDSLTGIVSINPTPITGMAVQSDPLSYLPAPSVGSCTVTDYSQTTNNTVVLNQGVYCGDATHPAINLTGNTVATFTGGTYIINGGGLNLAGNATITGT